CFQSLIPKIFTSVFSMNSLNLLNRLTLQPPSLKMTLQNRTIKVMDIPLSFDEAAVKAAFNQFGIIESVRMTTKNSWQQAFVTFVEEKSINPFFADLLKTLSQSRAGQTTF